MGQSYRDCPGFFGMKTQIFFNENMGNEKRPGDNKLSDEPEGQVA